MGYRGKVEQQNQARDLRAQGWTLTEICEQVGCSKASASLWCRDVEIDDEVLQQRRRARFLAGNEGARNRGPNKLQQRKAAEIEDARVEGSCTIGSLSDREFLVAGLAYYSGEGSKTDGAVKFANSDPRLLLFFVRWLRHFFDVDERRLRMHLYLHEGLDIEAANKFWSELTDIPTSQFIKPYRAVPDPSIRTSKHPLGCPAISYSCTRTHRRIMGMIDALLSCPDSEVGCDRPLEQIDPG
jgi:hypothetical protein